jgi:hypothetical protein
MDLVTLLAARCEQKVWRRMWKPPFAGSTARRCAFSIHMRMILLVGVAPSSQ